jgi:pimeloyl-ACP methyl ester carboxylesterase
MAILAGMSTRFTVKSARVTLAAESDGAGPALVCLHAGVCDRRMWRPLAAQLAADFQVLSYDRRGFGQTPLVDDEHSDLDDLRAVLDQCVPNASAVLVGASRGGALAIDMALAFPERVSALVLLGSSVSGEPDTAYVPAPIQALLDEIESAERSGDLERLNALEVRLWLDGPLMPEGRVGGELQQLLLDMNRIALSHPPLTRRTQPPPAYPRLEALRQPALVLCGDLDLPDCVALSQELGTRIPRARAELIEGAAHLPSLEQPETCARAMRAFFAEALRRT